MESATFLTSPSTGLSGILLSVRTHYSEGPEYEKYQPYNDVPGEVIPTPCCKTTGTTSNNLEKMDPSEIEKTYNIRKQQTRFY